MNRTAVRDRAARVAYRLAVKNGVQLDFINAAGTSVTLWGYIEDSRQITGLRNEGSTDDTAYTFRVPRQTNFPPAAFTTGCVVKYPTSNGTRYEVEAVEPDNEDILQASTFRVKCGRFGETAEID
jgi:hypothetical protein